MNLHLEANHDFSSVSIGERLADFCLASLAENFPNKAGTYEASLEQDRPIRLRLSYTLIKIVRVCPALSRQEISVLDNTSASARLVQATSASAPKTALTIAEAIILVGQWEHLSQQRRGALISSLRTTARVAKTDPAILRLSPEDLNDKFSGEAPQLHGVSATSMATNRSNVRYVMRRLSSLPDRNELTPPWATLRACLPPRARATLTRFCQFHSQAGVVPAFVSDDSFAACQIWVIQETLCRNPSQLFAKMRYVWNRMAKGLPHLNLPIIGAAQCRVLCTISTGDMQPSLQSDLEKFRTHLNSSDLDDLFDSDPLSDVSIDQVIRSAPRRALRAITVEERVRHARQAIWVVVQTGRSLDSITGLRNLVFPLDTAKLIIRYMWQRAGKKPSAPAGHVAEVLRQIAKYHVGVAESDVARIAGWKKTVSMQYNEMTVKNKKRVEALLAPEAEAKFLALPDVLMEEAYELLPHSPQLAVSAAKRALMVHLGTFYPFRVSNLVGLRADRHFVYANGSSGTITRFMIAGEEMKIENSQIDLPVLRLTNDFINKWNKSFRPLIAAAGNPFLFPGIANRSMTRQAFGASLKKIIVERVGCEINPHLLRHRAAIAYLKKHPGEFEVVRLILGHKTDETARRSYTGPERDAAFERFDESVLESMRPPRREKNRSGLSAPRGRQAKGTKRKPAPASAKASSSSSSL